MATHSSILAWRTPGTAKPGGLPVYGVTQSWTRLKQLSSSSSSSSSKGTLNAKLGTIKDRNGMYLKKAEDVKKRWQEYTEELYKKRLNDLDNHDGVVTHLELDSRHLGV